MRKVADYNPHHLRNYYLYVHPDFVVLHIFYYEWQRDSAQEEEVGRGVTGSKLWSDDSSCLSSETISNITIRIRLENPSLRLCCMR
jgi:hypothetical protein